MLRISVSRHSISRKTVKISRELRWVAFSWLDSSLLIIFMVTMDIPLIPLVVLGLSAVFFFLTGLATLLNPSVKYCHTCEDIFDENLEECPVCQAKLTTTPGPICHGTKSQKMKSTGPSHNNDEDSIL